MMISKKAAIQTERTRRLEEQEKMFAARKLCLVLDLDHTLLNSAKFIEVDPMHDEILRKKEEQNREKPQMHLYRFPHMGMWTKLRPGIWNFLEKASKLFEMHLYTMGNKLYATEMAKILDPKGNLFAGRVISRGDDGDPTDGDERVPNSKDLEALAILDLSVNNLVEPIPPILGNLSYTGKLQLNDNQLVGMIPAELVKLEQLFELNLANNLLEGPIPHNISSCTALNQFHVHGNRLNGSIPLSFRDLESLTDLNLSANSFHGRIPLELGHIIKLDTLDLSSNDFSGPVPASVGDLGHLLTLKLSGNNLDGPVPAEFGNLRSIQMINMSYNNLSGTIPGKLGQLQNLMSLVMVGLPSVKSWEMILKTLLAKEKVDDLNFKELDLKLVRDAQAVEQENDFIGTPYVPVYVILSTGVINNFCQLVDPEGIRQELSHIKSLNADCVIVDCWWGIVGSWSPQKYIWSGYRELFNIIREFKLQLQI